MSSKLPRITVIMSVYNYELFLKESIESILNQIYDNFEFIIVNDGSNDNSVNIINNYAQNDERITLVSRKNKGIPYSMNQALLLASGDYLAIMDADDVSLPNRFEKQVEYLEKNKLVDILATNVEVFGEISKDEKIEFEKWFNVDLNNCSNIEELLLENCYIAHPSVMMKMNVIKELNGYNLKYKRNEDYNLWLRAMNKGYKISILNEKLIKIRKHNDSKTHRDVNDFENIKDIIESRLEYIKDKFSFEKFNYVIWGASNGGKMAAEKINKIFPNAQLNGYVDKFKKGKFDDINIYSPEDLKEIKIDYIFIATAPGREEAKKFLINNKLLPVKDFLLLC